MLRQVRDRLRPPPSFLPENWKLLLRGDSRRSQTSARLEAYRKQPERTRDSRVRVPVRKKIGFRLTLIKNVAAQKSNRTEFVRFWRIPIWPDFFSKRPHRFCPTDQSCGVFGFIIIPWFVCGFIARTKLPRKLPLLLHSRLVHSRQLLVLWDHSRSQKVLRPCLLSGVKRTCSLAGRRFRGRFRG
jgi:hypothetical protein